jgi:hypothetical protein
VLPYLAERLRFRFAICSVLDSGTTRNSHPGPRLPAPHATLLPIIMSQSVLDIDETFFMHSPSMGSGPPKNVDIPDSLRSATQRLGFPPSYVVVGVYRLLLDKALFSPVWQNCRSGFWKSVVVGSVWVRDRNIQLAVNRRLTSPHVHSRF